MRTTISLSTAFHPQTDGQAEKTIQILVETLRACVLDFRGSWIDHLMLIELAYNNNFQSSIWMVLYEALYGRKCRSPICWDDVREKMITGPKLVHITLENVYIIHES